MVELKQLVRQADHPVGVPFHDGNQMPVCPVEGFRPGKLLHRPVDQGERRPEFVGDIGEEIGPFLVDLFHQHFFLFGERQPFTGPLHLRIIPQEKEQDSQSGEDVEGDGPRSKPGGGTHGDRLGELLFPDPSIR